MSGRKGIQEIMYFITHLDPEYTELLKINSKRKLDFKMNKEPTLICRTQTVLNSQKNTTHYQT